MVTDFVWMMPGSRVTGEGYLLGMKFGSCHPLNKKKGPDDRTTGTIAAVVERLPTAAASSYCYDDEDLDSKRFVLSITANGIAGSERKQQRGEKMRAEREKNIVAGHKMSPFSQYEASTSTTSCTELGYFIYRRYWC